MEPSTDGENGAADAPTVLVVDDEPGVADLYAAWLKEHYPTRTAYGGAEALEAIDESVGVVLLDRRMPDHAGDEVCADIREAGHPCRIAMVTAVQPDINIIELGFDDYVTKPVSRDELLELVDGLVRRQQYDETVEELFSLVAKRAALEDELSQDVLESSEEYQALLDRIEAAKAAADDHLDQLYDGEPHATVRHLLGGESA